MIPSKEEGVVVSSLLHGTLYCIQSNNYFLLLTQHIINNAAFQRYSSTVIQHYGQCTTPCQTLVSADNFPDMLVYSSLKDLFIGTDTEQFKSQSFARIHQIEMRLGEIMGWVQDPHYTYYDITICCSSHPHNVP